MPALAEALALHVEWRERDEAARAKAGLRRREWYGPKGARLSKGMPWGEFAAQGDMFRRPSPEAEVLGDLFAAADAARSFDAEDAETEAGKKRAYGLVTKFLEDYAAVADAANTETADLLGDAPPSRAELVAAARGRAADDGRRFSAKADLLAEIDMAFQRNNDGFYTKSGGSPVHFANHLPILSFLGVRMDGIFSTVERIRKMVGKHFLTKEQIARLPEAGNAPAAVFLDVNDKGAHVVLTSELAPYEKGNNNLKPVMIWLEPSKHGGGFIASAYSRSPENEAAYRSWWKKLRYIDENKIAGLGLEGETDSLLRPQASGDNVKTAADFAAWLPAQSIPQSATARQGGAADAQRFSVSPAEDAAYMDAVRRGDMATARRMVREAAARAMPNTKVVGEDELPKVVYHGTPKYGFTVFRENAVGSTNDPGAYGRGYYFTEIKDDAEGYKKPGIAAAFENYYNSIVGDNAATSNRTTTAGIYEVFLNIRNPKIIRSREEGVAFRKEFRIFPEDNLTETERELIRTEVDKKSKSVSEDDWDYDEEQFRIEKERELKDRIQKESVERLRRVCDGVIVMRDGVFKEIVAFSSSQIKSADPVTYDDAGNVIPLSQRFNPQSNDIRFSVSPVYTGSAADYANRSRQGGLDDGPSLKKIGTGEGSQVYGWGLYGSTVRGVAERYANRGIIETEINGKKVDIDSISARETPEGTIADHARSIVIKGGKATRDELIREIGAAYNDYAERAKDKSKWNHAILVEVATRYRDALQLLEDKSNSIAVRPKGNLYEQTFFTNRAPGDESHLLKWYEPVNEEQKQWIDKALKDAGLGGLRELIDTDNANERKAYNASLIPEANAETLTGEDLYAALERTMHSPKAASEFLARAGIDGVKYPVDSYGGKGVKDGDEAGWNYVAFSDEHIRVDHKWTDGEQRFSVTVTPEVRAAVTVDAKDATLGKTKAALAALAGKPLVNDETKIEAWINDVQARKIVSNKAVAKSEANGFTKAEHNAAAAIIDTLWKYASLGKSDADKDGDPNIRSVKRFVAPVFFHTGDGAKSAYAYITAKESVEHGHRIYSIEIEKLEALGKRLDLNQALLPNAPSAAYDTKSAPARQEGAADAQRFSVSPAEDAAYMDAVRRGDMETAQRMVRPLFEKYAESHKISIDEAARLFAKIAKATYDRTTYFEVYGIRGDKRLLVPDDAFPNSHSLYQDSDRVEPEDWDDEGNPVFKMYEFAPEFYDGGELPGTSTLGLNEDDFDDEKHLAGKIKEALEQEYAHENEYVYLVGGDSAGWGEDNGEHLISNAEVLSVLCVVSSETEGTYPNRKKRIFYTNKSADPVTYDDAGNVIPLSQRFNPQSNDIRFSVSPVYTGSAADYANRSRQGGVDDGPSVKYIGTGEGAQVYGWGLYGSNRRGVGITYAQSDVGRKGNGKLPFLRGIDGAGTKKNGVLMEKPRKEDYNLDLQYWADMIAWESPNERIALQTAKKYGEAIESYLEAYIKDYEFANDVPSEHLYEQTFFTNRALGDESHLLKWYEAVTKENMERIRAQLLKEGVENAWLADDAENDFRGYKAEEVYANLARTLGSAKAASEFLYRAGIDGVKYPVDSYGKTVKDGDEAGWNYVAFSDEHIRVDHKWTDGKQRFSVTVNPEVRAAVTVDAKEMTREKAFAAMQALAKKPLKNLETGIVAQLNAEQRDKILSNAAVRKSLDNGFDVNEHNAAASIIETLWRYAHLAKSDHDRDNDPNIASIKRFVSPVFFGRKAAYAYITAKESVQHGHRIYSLELEKLEALEGMLRDRNHPTSNASTPHILPQSAPARQEGAARELARLVAEGNRARGAGGAGQEGGGAFSAAPGAAEGEEEGAYPSLRGMSDDELVAAALAVKMALGKASDERLGKVANRRTYGGLATTTVEKMLHSVHPDWDRARVALPPKRAARNYGILSSKHCKERKAIMTITDDIKYIGVNDHDIDLFEGQYDVPLGMAYNSYLVKDEKNLVFDTVDRRFGDEWLAKLRAELGGAGVDYLVVQHMEPDHSANIARFAAEFPGATIVSSAQAFAMMKNYFGTDFAQRRIVVKEGDTLSTGRHVFAFVSAPMVHWPEVTVTFDTTDKVLFSADGFGKFGALDREDTEGWDCEARRYYFGIVGKFGAQVQALLKKAASLDIKTICPLHGPVLSTPEEIAHVLKQYNTWSSYGVESPGLLIAYTSVYGHTEEAALLLKDMLLERGCPKVATADLARDDQPEAVEDAFRYGAVVLATTTYNMDIFPWMRHFIEHLTERNYQNRLVGLIENGSWAPAAARVMRSMFEKSKGITFCENTVTIKGALNDESRARLAALADELAAWTARR